MPYVEVIIQLNASLVWLAEANARAGQLLRAKVESRLGVWLDRMGIPAQPRIVLTTGQHDQGPRFLDFSILVGGHRCPYSRYLIARVYEATTRQLPTASTARLSSIREWLNARLSGKGDVSGGEMADALEFVAQLAVETVTASPTAVMGGEIAMVWIDKARGSVSTLADALSRLDPKFVESVLQRLLTFPIALTDHATIAEWLLDGRAASQSGEQIAERLYDTLRPGLIELRLNPDTLASLLPGELSVKPGQRFQIADLPDEIGQSLHRVGDDLYYDPGLYLPQIVCVADAELPQNTFQFRINHRWMPLRSVLPADRILAVADPSQLQHLGLVGEPLLHPESGAEAASIPRTDQMKATSGGIAVRSPFDYIGSALVHDMRWMADRLLSVGDVDYILVRFDRFFPALVRAAGWDWDALKFTRVLRHLLKQGIGIRDLRTIFELLLDFRYTSGIRAPTAGWGGVEPYLYVGDMELTGPPYFSEIDPYLAKFDLSPFQLFAGPRPAWLENGRLAAEFAKCGLKRELTHKHSRGQSTIICHLVDPEVEQQLMECLAENANGSPSQPFAPERAEAILSAMVDILDDYLPGNQMPPIFIASTPDVALLFYDLIAEDFPEMPVIHRQLIDPSAWIQPIDRVPGLQPQTWE